MSLVLPGRLSHTSC